MIQEWQLGGGWGMYIRELHNLQTTGHLLWATKLKHYSQKNLQHTVKMVLLGCDVN